MKKFLKRLLIVLGVLAALYFIIALFLPSDYKIERSREIAASPEAVYGQITKFENWDKWSPWKEKDPSAVYSIEGEDGTVGCIQKWKGDPDISGEGQLEITELVENESFAYDLSFVGWDMTSKGKISLEATETGTKISWSDEGEISYMMRPIMLFMDMDAMLGAMFERGLERIDSVALIAQTELNAITYEIQTISFPSSYYLGIRTDEMNISDIDSTLYGATYAQLAEYCAESGIRAIGMPVSFGFSWDDEKGVCVLMPAFPIEKSEDVEMPVESYTIEACKALLIEYYGEYDEMGPAHEQMESYIAAKGYSYSVVMEEFMTDPTTVEGPEDVLTKIYYFLK